MKRPGVDGSSDAGARFMGGRRRGPFILAGGAIADATTPKMLLIKPEVVLRLTELTDSDRTACSKARELPSNPSD